MRLSRYLSDDFARMIPTLDCTKSTTATYRALSIHIAHVYEMRIAAAFLLTVGGAPISIIRRRKKNKCSCKLKNLALRN